MINLFWNIQSYLFKNGTEFKFSFIKSLKQLLFMLSFIININQKDDLKISTDLYTVLLAEFGKNNEKIPSRHDSLENVV